MISNVNFLRAYSVVNRMKRSQISRQYISRAHPPSSVTVFSLNDAVGKVLNGIEERMEQREEKWEKNKEKRNTKDEGPYRNQDETVDLALNLNLDPRKPGQALRGSLALPHGSGKKVKVIAFTSSDEIADDAMKAGASIAGGLSLIESISNGDTPIDFDRALATPEIMPLLSRVARVLGPKGLMPNVKLNTIQSPENIVNAVKDQITGSEIQYRAEKNGIIHVGIGKGSFGNEKILENIKVFMNGIHDIKPESFGKGKKKSNNKNKGGASNAKYYLKAHLTATQGKSFNIDLRTLDPMSPFFMTEPS